MRIHCKADNHSDDHPRRPSTYWAINDQVIATLPWRTRCKAQLEGSSLRAARSSFKNLNPFSYLKSGVRSTAEKRHERKCACRRTNGRVCVCVWGGGGSLGVCVASFDYLIFKTIGNLKFGIVTRWMGGTRWPWMVKVMKIFHPDFEIQVHVRLENKI